VITFVLMLIDFDVLWRYFAWCNQTLAVFTLWACTVWLARHGKFYMLTLVPALFMQVVTVSYILLAPVPEGFGLDHELSFWLAAGSCALCLGLFARYLTKLPSNGLPERDERIEAV